jgi:hypothetical protein
MNLCSGDHRRSLLSLLFLGLGALCPSAMAKTQAFTLLITSPANNASVPAGAPLTITATVSGNANPIAKLDFYDLITGKVLGTAMSAPYTITWTPAGITQAFLRVTGTDSTGVTANSAITSIRIYSTSAGSTAASTYTVAVSGGTANGMATGSFAPGTTVTLAAGTPPTGQWFKQWTGNAPVADSLAATTTFTMPAANVSMSATYFTPVPVPQPVTTHPRLWVTPNDVANLQGWAGRNIATYQSLRKVLQQSVNVYNTKYYPGGIANPQWPDYGDTQGYTGELSEQHALVFAFFSLIDPDPAARILHAQRARNLLIPALTEVAKGHLAGAPFRDPMFALFNRANFTSEAWPLAVDWIYNAVDASNQPVLSAADKLVIRDAFLVWANDCLNAYTCGGDHPAPIGAMNSNVLLPGGGAHRTAANNYYSGHARLLTLMSLCIDPADDPAVNAAIPAPVLGNTLRSYLADALGAWLYQQYAIFGDPQGVIADYGLAANAKVGLASGGLSPEGGLYGHSYSYLLGEMLALQTAGFNDVSLAGPQAKLLSSPVWDRYLAGFAHTIEPVAKVPAGQSYLGPVYQYANYGDVLRLWITPDFMQSFALLNLLDQKQNHSSNSIAPNSRLNATRWFAVNAVEGGAAGLTQRISQPWSWGVQNSILYFLLLDPDAPQPSDPRPALAVSFYDPGIGRLLARTDWSPAASIFTFRSSWENINHQNGDAGQFELFRHGEWLTKELSTYDNNGNGQSSLWHNSLALQNWCAAGTPTLNFFEAAYWPNGSQWNNGANAGDPVTVASSGPGYAFATTDMTKLYNRPSPFTPSNALLDIQHASRDVLWVNRDFAIVYDRATSLHNGFKRFNLNLPAVPVIDNANHLATVVTPKGQYLFLQTLLPASPAITYATPGSSVSSIAALETMTGRLVVEDATNPTDIRFLHVVQGADTASDRLPATLVRSSSGNAYTGAVLGAAAALFPDTLGSGFAGVSYSTPATATKHYVAGLQPGGSYTVVADSVNGTTDVAILAGANAGGTVLQADPAGVLAVDLTLLLP